MILNKKKVEEMKYESVFVNTLKNLYGDDEHHSYGHFGTPIFRMLHKLTNWDPGYEFEENFVINEENGLDYIFLGWHYLYYKHEEQARRNVTRNVGETRLAFYDIVYEECIKKGITLDEEDLKALDRVSYY